MQIPPPYTDSDPFPRDDKLLAKAQVIIDAKLASIDRELREISLSIHGQPVPPASPYLSSE